MIVVVHKSVMSMSERERERAELSNGNHEWAPRKFGIDKLATRPRRRLGLCHKSNCKRTSDESKEGGFDHMPKRSSRETRSVRSREKTTRNERDWRGCMKRIGDTKKSAATNVVCGPTRTGVRTACFQARFGRFDFAGGEGRPD